MLVFGKFDLLCFLVTIFLRFGLLEHLEVARAEVYLWPCQTSIMELLCENGQPVIVVVYFRKKAP